MMMVRACGVIPPGLESPVALAEAEDVAVDAAVELVVEVLEGVADALVDACDVVDGVGEEVDEAEAGVPKADAMPAASDIIPARLTVGEL